MDISIEPGFTRYNDRRDVFILAEKHKTYSVEFREYVTKMVVLDGHKMTAMSDKLDIPYGT